MLAEDHGRHLCGRSPKPHRQQAAEAERVEQGAQANHMPLRQRELSLGKRGENIDGIADHQHDRVAPHAR